MAKEKTAAELVRMTTRNLCATSQRERSAVVKSGKNGCCEISRYGEGELTPAVLAGEIKKLRVAFPSREAAFFDLLAERLIANGFTDDRLKDAVVKALDTFSYKEINISDIIGYDRRVRLYTYP